MSDTLTHQDNEYNSIVKAWKNYWRRDPQLFTDYLRDQGISDQQIVKLVKLPYSAQTLGQKYPRKESQRVQK